MKFIFSTGSLYTYSIERCFDFAAQAGFNGIELMVDYRWDTRQPDYLQQLIDRYDLPVSVIHSPFSPKIAGWPASEMGRIEASVKLAEAIGAQVVVHHLPRRIGLTSISLGNKRILLPLGPNPDRRYAAWLESDYLSLQSKTKVKLCIENMPARQVLGQRLNGHYWNTIGEIARFPQITLDTTHLGTWGIDPNQAYAQLRGRVHHVHLSNFDGREHRLPEKGHLKLDRLISTMAKDDYPGVITLELHPDALYGGETDAKIIETMRASLEHCRRWAV